MNKMKTITGNLKLNILGGKVIKKRKIAMEII
jgi:hypothetical protein